MRLIWLQNRFRRCDCKHHRQGYSVQCIDRLERCITLIQSAIERPLGTHLALSVCELAASGRSLVQATERERAKRRGEGKLGAGTHAVAEKIIVFFIVSKPCVCSCVWGGASDESMVSMR